MEGRKEGGIKVVGAGTTLKDYSFAVGSPHRM